VNYEPTCLLVNKLNILISRGHYTLSPTYREINFTSLSKSCDIGTLTDSNGQNTYLRCLKVICFYHGSIIYKIRNVTHEIKKQFSCYFNVME